MPKPLLSFPCSLANINKVKFEEVVDVIMGQSPPGKSYNNEGIGSPLINGPTEFGRINPKVIQWTTSPTKYSKKNDVLLCVKGSSIGRMNISNDIYCIGRGVAAIRTKNEQMDKGFLKYFLENKIEKILIKSAGSTFPNISGRELKQVVVFLPEIEEQRKIAEFFTLLDQRIEKQQEKVEALKEQKRGLLQKIFSQELRFKDDEGKEFPEWETNPLNYVVERVTRKNKNLESTLPLTISAQYGLVDQTTFFNKTVASSNLYGYYLLKKGEFAYNKSYSNGFPLGAIKRLNKYSQGVLSSLYICFKPKGNVRSDFLEHYFNSSQWYQEVVLISVEGARNHGLLNIPVNDFFATKHKLPSLGEQKKIAEFLNFIVQKIDKEEEKLTSMQSQKKGFMQQMFV